MDVGSKIRITYRAEDGIEETEDWTLEIGGGVTNDLGDESELLDLIYDAQVVKVEEV